MCSWIFKDGSEGLENTSLLVENGRRIGSQCYGKRVHLWLQHQLPGGRCSLQGFPESFRTVPRSSGATAKKATQIELPFSNRPRRCAHLLVPRECAGDNPIGSRFAHRSYYSALRTSAERPAQNPKLQSRFTSTSFTRAVANYTSPVSSLVTVEIPAHARPSWHR